MSTDRALSYAGFWPRAFAIVVDTAVLIPPICLNLAVRSLSIGGAMVGTLLSTIQWLGYEVYFLSRWGQTIGKMVAGIKVTRLDGSPIALKQAWLRSSVDIGLAGIDCVALIYILATWTGPEWSSLKWLDQSAELGKRNPLYPGYEWVSQAWIWSELVVLLFNKKRRSLHDFIAGTVVVKVRAPDAASDPPDRTALGWR